MPKQHRCYLSGDSIEQLRYTTHRISSTKVQKAGSAPFIGQTNL
jgi:hypothetical protein